MKKLWNMEKGKERKKKGEGRNQGWKKEEDEGE